MIFLARLADEKDAKYYGLQNFSDFLITGEFMTKKTLLLCLLLSLFLLAGCGAKNKSTLKQPPPKIVPQMIAVVPVINHGGDPLISRIVRQRAIENLYFKGYPRIEARTIDERLTRLYGDMSFAGGSIPPAVIGELTGADAALYCSVNEMKTSYHFMYARAYVELSFEVRSTKTGETIWQTKQGASERNFGFSKKNLENKTVISYEAAINDIFRKVAEKLPEGPNLAP